MQTRPNFTANKPVLPGKPTSSDAVMDILHELVLTTDTKRVIIDLLGKEVEREDARVKMAEQYRLKKDLDLFATYEENWDGEGGHPLTSQVIQNFESLLPLISTKALQNIDVYPENNGSLLIMSRTQEAGLNIGNDAYTYYVIHDNKISGESHLVFSVDAVLDKIEEIAQ